MSAATKFEEALKSWPKGQRHTHVMQCANFAALAGIPQGEAAARITAAMPRPPTPRNEVEAAVAKAYAESVTRDATATDGLLDWNSPIGRDSPQKVAPSSVAQVSFYDSKTDRTGAPMPLAEILEGIKGGKWAALIEPVRAAAEAGNAAAKDAAKRQLPAFTPGGLFAARKRDGLSVHSGYVVADIDGLTTEAEAVTVRDALARDVHVQAAFISPSGRGVKALVLVEPCADADEHKAAFAALVAYFSSRHGIALDTSGKDVSRLCFVSHDSGAFIRKRKALPFMWREPDADVDAPGTEDNPNPLAGAKSLAELATQPINLEANLLGERLLCRCGGLLYVARTGVGKSSSSTQQDALFALGRPAFGIVPAKPLNILCVQAENDDGDLKEMALGVIRGLGLNDTDVEQLHKRTTYVQWFVAGEAFLVKLRKALTFARDEGKPFDLVRIDPLMAFAGGDLVKPEVIASFCRVGLNSIAHDFDIGIIAVHHTPKINLTTRPRMDGPEWIYAATGCADLSNWARAILVITDCGSGSGVFRLIGAKRGKRVGWRDTNGEREFERHFAHAENDGGMYWREATPDEILSATSKPTASKKPDALQAIAMKSPEEMAAHAERILRKKPLNATDFNTAIMREYSVNPKYAATVAKMLTGELGDADKPVWMQKIGKQHFHGLHKQIEELRNPPLAGV